MNRYNVCILQPSVHLLYFYFIHANISRTSEVITKHKSNLLSGVTYIVLLFMNVHYNFIRILEYERAVHLFQTYFFLTHKVVRIRAVHIIPFILMILPHMQAGFYPILVIRLPRQPITKIEC